MGKYVKLMKRIVGGEYNNISFKELQQLLQRAGFGLKRIKGSHHIYAKEGVEEIINIQPDSKGDAKIYQVKQFRGLLISYGLVDLSADSEEFTAN